MYNVILYYPQFLSFILIYMYYIYILKNETSDIKSARSVFWPTVRRLHKESPFPYLASLSYVYIFSNESNKYGSTVKREPKTITKNPEELFWPEQE